MKVGWEGNAGEQFKRTACFTSRLLKTKAERHGGRGSRRCI